MLSSKIVHELQFSLYNFVICHMFYKITVFKMAGKDCSWLLPYGIREISHTYLLVSAPFQTISQLQLHLKK